jgi:hypothetical protein
MLIVRRRVQEGASPTARHRDHHPHDRGEKPVGLTDVHATIYKALGIPADHNYVTEAGRST